MCEMAPRIPILGIVFATGSPLPFRDVRAPFLPVFFSLPILLQALFFLAEVFVIIVLDHGGQSSFVNAFWGKSSCAIERRERRVGKSFTLIFSSVSEAILPVLEALKFLAQLHLNDLNGPHFSKPRLEDSSNNLIGLARSDCPDYGELHSQGSIRARAKLRFGSLKVPARCPRRFTTTT